MTVQQAIETSQHTNTIVHVQATEIDEIDFLIECDDSVDTGSITEYWGTDWRVHVHH